MREVAMNLFVFLCRSDERGPVRGTTIVAATHPTRRSLASTGWVLITTEIRGWLKSKHDGYSRALQEAREDAIRHGLRSTNPEFEVHMEEYLQDRGISMPSQREALIAVLRKGGFEVLENVPTYVL